MVDNVYALRGDMDEFRVILVTGPQRSGTTFMAKAFSEDMRRPFVDEAVFGISNRDLWRRLVDGSVHVVIQCPTMMRWVHDVPDDVLVVVMRRDVKDILASQERIGWGDNDVELAPYGLESGIAAEVKYDWWDRYKQDAPANWLEVDYESMRNHPLWVKKRMRKDFGAKQTKVMP